MGLFSSITKLFKQDANVETPEGLKESLNSSECCTDGVCTCSSSEVTPTSPTEEVSVAVTADEINIALEEAAEAD